MCNLYPFVATVASGASAPDCIEKIDIGGPSMIRAAAKNHADVAVVTDPSDYAPLLEALKAGAASLQFRRRLAWKAFAHCAAYDSAVADWFWADGGARAEGDDPFPPQLTVPLTLASGLRYGENPHQAAAFYTCVLVIHRAALVVGVLTRHVALPQGVVAGGARAVRRCHRQAAPRQGDVVQ